jgi:hypothetical protein
MPLHGNSLKNKKSHHLYEIHDREEDDIFKYGISDSPIDDEGQSRRMKSQVNYLNKAVGWLRYFAVLVINGITGKSKARELENEQITKYEQKHGRKPRGNV